MNSTNMLLAAPEFWVLIMACVILIVDLFLSKERRGIIHMLAMMTLVFAAIITLRGRLRRATGRKRRWPSTVRLSAIRWAMC